MPEIRIGAHRGAMCHATENTLAAFEKAVEFGTYRIELDVRRTADGVLILMHDETVDRTTNGTGKVAELDYAAIQKLRGSDGATVPTFSETLEFARDTVRLLVEVKDSAAVDDIVVSIKLAGLCDRCTVSCFDEGVLKRVKELEPRIETAWFHLKPGPLDVARLVNEFGVGLVIFWPAGADPEQIKACRAAGLDARTGFRDDLSYEEIERLGHELIGHGMNELACGRPDWIGRLIASA